MPIENVRHVLSHDCIPSLLPASCYLSRRGTSNAAAALNADDDDDDDDDDDAFVATAASELDRDRDVGCMDAEARCSCAEGKVMRRIKVMQSGVRKKLVIEILSSHSCGITREISLKLESTFESVKNETEL